MSVWDDTFSKGDRFQHVFWCAPLISMVILSGAAGVAYGGPGGLILGPVLGVVALTLTYLCASLPAMAVWFAVFRLARRAGLGRRGAALMAAPAMALMGSIVFIVVVALTFGEGNEFGEDGWGELLPVMILVSVPMALTLLVTLTGGSSRQEPPSEQRSKPNLSNPADKEDGGRAYRSFAITAQGAKA